MGLAPSEVRDMTPAEIMAVVDAKKPEAAGGADLAELYDDLMEARSGGD